MQIITGFRDTEITRLYFLEKTYEFKKKHNVSFTSPEATNLSQVLTTEDS